MTFVDPIAVLGLVRSGLRLLENVKVYKRRCHNLISRCVLFISGLQDGDGAIPADRQDACNEAEGILRSICDRVLEWSQLNTAKSLLRQDAIRDGLDEYDKKIEDCITRYHIVITNHLALESERRIIAAQNDITEIREMMHDFLVSFIRYRADPTLDVSYTSPAFRTVLHDIEEETREIPSAEENDNRMQPSIDMTVNRQMIEFSKSLVNLDLETMSVDGTASERSPRRVPNRRYPDSPSELTQSVGHRRVSTDYPPILPPLSFENVTYPEYEETTLTERSPSFSNYSYSSRSTSVVSGSAFRYPSRSLKAMKPETLENIIEYLLKHSAQNDNGQSSVFFIALPGFATPFHVLRVFTIRYYETFLDQDAKQRLDDQTCILRFLNNWLKNEHVIFDHDILVEMSEFLAFVNRESKGLEELVFDIWRGIREKDYKRSPTPPIVSPALQRQRGWPAPCDLAIALEVLEGERYKRIVASEYMACVSGQQPYCPNLSAAIELNQLISKWVLSCILDQRLGTGQDGITARSKTKQYFVETAKECQNIRNFSSSGAIISALKSGIIARLTATQGGMSFGAKWKLKNLKRFFGKKYDYQDYRRALENQQICSIPWHVVDLEDIQAMMEGEADTDEGHNSTRIHLERWAHLKQRAMSALRYHVTFREDDVRQAMAKEYLMAKLQHVLVENSDQERISLILSAEEEKILYRRAGF